MTWTLRVPAHFASAKNFFLSFSFFSLSLSLSCPLPPTSSQPLDRPRTLAYFREMDAPPSTADLLLLLQRQNDNLYGTFNALAGNISESFKTIGLLQQENTRLNKIVRSHETRTLSGIYVFHAHFSNFFFISLCFYLFTPAQ